jgi:hypothetical protein
MVGKLTPHVRKKQRIFTQTQMSRTKIEQRPRCSARCKGKMGIETESERGSGKQRTTRSARCAPLCSVIVPSPPRYCLVVSNLRWKGPNQYWITLLRLHAHVLLRAPVALDAPRINRTGASTCHSEIGALYDTITERFFMQCL